ncbi:hypothetical protein P168DRAFT_321182 [Aspergillus campestris IBT 28561]|uniref:FAD linked oxidase N-terminal domain-containing protein n=1 Tax=Aspergillus campestris (strain IBT 28561) TaxID=1392248 RepID=A0A2I1CVF5_ASPC2|nr:uncharacterized protein P168DRAFT_321182 [Aspergillus campestris IBT 28561]PKY01601.1 hypothetical protein P168DRAFT_321182 [Aspergillus campestris IBT 28561]
MAFNQFIQSLDLSNNEALKVRTLLESQVTDSLEQVATSSTGQNVALATSTAKIVFRENIGWIGSESENYIATCETNCQSAPRIITTLKVPFAIRSGGHNPNRGWASAGENAILIDMNRICDVVLSQDKKTVEIGPGNRWQKVRVDPWGRVPSFSSEYGLACDNVRAFEVVLSDSSIVNASRTENPDLFWAFKGGGFNFGIVTKFTYWTVPIDKIWFAARIYEPSANGQILKAIEEWQKAAENESRGSIIHHIGHRRTLLGWIYSSPVEFPPLFEMFYDIPYESWFVESTIGTILDFTKSTSNRVLGTPQKLRREAFGMTTRPSADFYTLAYDRWRQVTDELYGQTGCDMGMVVQPLTTSAMKIGRENGGNALNTAVEPQQWMSYLAQWVNEDDDERVRKAVFELRDYLRENAAQMGILLPFVFMNNATFAQDPLTGYGAQHIARMKEVSRKYDAEQVFQTLQGDGFLLRKV